MDMNKEFIKRAVIWNMVNYDEWDCQHIGGDEHVVHNVNIENVNIESDDLVQVAFPQKEHIINLKEELVEEKLYASEDEVDEWGNSKRYYQLLDELEHWLSGEVNDIFDYDAEPIILVNGQIL